MKTTGTILVSLILGACANPINQVTADRYLSAGIANIQQDKWFEGRMAFGRAWMNADWGNLDDRKAAMYAYEYGRASGAICDWPEAELGLTKALELDQKTNGPIHMTQMELARMYHAQGKIDQSLHWFEIGITELDRLDAADRAPADFSRLLAEYAKVLEKFGQNEQANDVAARAKAIVAAHPDKHPDDDHTPYGKFCDQHQDTRQKQ